MRFDTFLKCLSAGIFSIAGLIWGDMDSMMTALLILIALDIVTGFIVGGIEHKLSSEVCFKGMAKKVLILILVAVGHVLDAYVLDTTVCRNAICGFFIANEGLSILENCGHFIPYPKWLKNALLQLRNKSDTIEPFKGDADEKDKKA